MLFVLTVNVKVWPASLAGPTLIPVAHPATVCAPASSFTVWLSPSVKVGASFTAVTLIVTVATFESASPSFAL